MRNDHFVSDLFREIVLLKTLLLFTFKTILTEGDLVTRHHQIIGSSYLTFLSFLSQGIALVFENDVLSRL